jgi:hypothetical protein
MILSYFSGLIRRQFNKPQINRVGFTARPSSLGQIYGAMSLAGYNFNGIAPF